jgi:hypothetical protein
VPETFTHLSFIHVGQAVAPKSIHMGFVVDKLALKQIFLQAPPFHITSFHQCIVVYLSLGEWTTGPLEATVRRQTFLPHYTVNRIVRPDSFESSQVLLFFSCRT